MTATCFNGGHLLVDPVWSDDEGCVVCATCAEELAELAGGDGVLILIHEDENGEPESFSYAPVTDPAIVDLERRLGAS